MNLSNSLYQAWKNRKHLNDQYHDRDIAQFLPPALEIQASPPHPLARWLGWSLIVFFILVLLWAFLSSVNIVASAEGKIIPSSRVKQIQPLEKAVVKKILIKEGQYVQQGDPLIELDNTQTRANQSRLMAELDALKSNQAVSRAFLALLRLPSEAQEQLSFAEIMLNDELSTPVYQQLLWQQWQAYWSEYQALKNQRLKTEAEQAAEVSQISKLKQTLPIVEKRAQKLKSLYQKNFVAEEKYLALEQERIEQVQDLASSKHRLRQLQAKYSEIQQNLQGLLASNQAKQLAKLTDYDHQQKVVSEELTKAKDLNARQVLYAPVSGQIQELATHTIGGVVTEAQQLMLIVPHEAQLDVEVFLENKDIGFVNEGMKAEIKVHTFPFTKYGVIKAEVLNVSDDATLDEQRGLLYRMHLLMDKNALWVEGKQVKLIPGMEVTAEMQTGQRKIIEFFLAPLLRYKREGLRER